MELGRIDRNFPQQRVPYSEKQKAEFYANSIDYIIDMGPEGGDRGGNVVACGTPEEVAEAEGSHTGRYLKKILRRDREREEAGL